MANELGRDYFHFDPVRHALVGERSDRVYQLAGRMRVRVVRVDLETTKIDFVPADVEASDDDEDGRPRRSKRSRR